MAMRQEDNRIPKHWRDGFVRFTGVQPTYEEYERSPEMWVEDPQIDTRLVIGMAIATAVMSIMLIFAE